MNRKTVIPQNAQVPVAIVLGILFIFLLVWRFGPWKEGEEAAVVVIGSEETEVEVSLDDLKKVLAEIRADQIERVAMGTTAPPLKRNPFGRVEDRRAQTAPERGRDLGTSGEGSEDMRVEAFRASRQERLEALRLCATCIMGEARMAMINDVYCRIGDNVGGFVIKAIKEREVILEDAVGSEYIRMSEAASL